MKLSVLKKICWWGDGCIGLAAEDLARDIYAVSGLRLPVEEGAVTGAGILSVGITGVLPEADGFFDALPSGWEEYSAAVCPDRILILGADKRAAMWGIYKLSEKLGIPACHRYSLQKPSPKKELPEERWSDRPKTFRFRGWFLNDEDLLTKRRISGGKRDIDYGYYHDVCDASSMEEAVETALRLGVNLIIPGSLIDIDEPYQKALVDYCIRRGFYVTQHHIEPVGVSWWAYNNYYKRRGMEIPPYSFLQNKASMVTVWRHYIGLWAQYGDNVIWQLGLRGRADTPVWKADAAKMDAEGWGGYISDAIATQYRLIREAVGKPFYSTATMWMEGAAMYAAGELQLPKDTMPVFSDVGITQMMATDFYTTPRDPKTGSGIYYHVAYWGSGPHLAMGNNPVKLLYNYDQAIEKGDTAYSILNVSNVREVIYCAAVNSRVVWDRDRFDLAAFDREFARTYFENEGLWDFFQEFFSCYVQGDIATDLAKSRNYSFDIIRHDTPFPDYPINDGDIRVIGRFAITGREYKPGWPARFLESIRRFQALEEKVSALPASDYFAEYKLQLRYLIRLTGWSRFVCLYRETGDGRHLACAARELESWLEERKALEKPPFENWLRGDDKINIRKLLADTEEKLRHR